MAESNNKWCNYYVSEEYVLVHNKCNKHVDKKSLQEALDYKDKIMTDSGEIIKKGDMEFHVGDDPCWTWRFDNHPGTNDRNGSHINVEKWKKPYGSKNNNVFRDIHIWYPK